MSNAGPADRGVRHAGPDARRICDHPYDPVFGAPGPPVPGRRVADLGDSGFIEFIADKRPDWYAFITWGGQVGDLTTPG